MNKAIYKAMCLCFLVCLVVCGCQDGGYVKATKEDFTLSLPDTSSSQGSEENRVLTPEEMSFVGVWKLDSAEEDYKETFYNDAYYAFNEDGSYSLKVADESAKGTFRIEDGILKLSKHGSLQYSFDGLSLTLVTKSGTKHNLTKMSEITFE